jgi:hypothetical protein
MEKEKAPREEGLKVAATGLEQLPNILMRPLTCRNNAFFAHF